MMLSHFQQLPVRCLYHACTMSVLCQYHQYHYIQTPCNAYRTFTRTMHIQFKYYVSTYRFNCHIMIPQVATAGFYFIFICKATFFSFWVIYTNVTTRQKIFNTSQCFFIWVLCKSTQILYYLYKIFILCPYNVKCIRCLYYVRTIHI